MGSCTSRDIRHPQYQPKLPVPGFQVDEVKNIMVDNIEKVLERGEKIELLVDKSENLRDRVSLCLMVQPTWAADTVQHAASPRKRLNRGEGWGRLLEGNETQIFGIGQSLMSAGVTANRS